LKGAFMASVVGRLAERRNLTPSLTGW